MAKITAVIDMTNRYRNILFVDGRMLASGNSGLEDIQLVPKGKRTMVQITLSQADVIIVDQICPKAKKPGEPCELLDITRSACDGCPRRITNT